MRDGRGGRSGVEWGRGLLGHMGAIVESIGRCVTTSVNHGICSAGAVILGSMFVNRATFNRQSEEMIRAIWTARAARVLKEESTHIIVINILGHPASSFGRKAIATPSMLSR